MSDLLAHTLERPAGLIECDVVLDIGPGIRPMGWYKPRTHVCIEPYGPYADRLQAEGYTTLRGTALEWLPRLSGCWDSAIYFLDSLEHMTREDGWEALRHARNCNPRQIVVFTPDGFAPQHGDAWGLGGDEWQEHRSGWEPTDFPGWVCTGWPRGPAFTAVWTRS